MAMPAAHIIQGSQVTYKVHCWKTSGVYFPSLSNSIISIPSNSACLVAYSILKNVQENKKENKERYSRLALCWSC